MNGESDFKRAWPGAGKVSKLEAECFHISLLRKQAWKPPKRLRKEYFEADRIIILAGSWDI